VRSAAVFEEAPNAAIPKQRVTAPFLEPKESPFGMDAIDPEFERDTAELPASSGFSEPDPHGVLEITQPTNTNSGNSGRRASPAAMSWSRFGSRAQWSSGNDGEVPVRHTSARAHARLGVRPPEPGIPKTRCHAERQPAGLVQWFECNAALFPLWIRPHWNRLVALSIRSRNGPVAYEVGNTAGEFPRSGGNAYFSP
jgi:hypothetical protein